MPDQIQEISERITPILEVSQESFFEKLNKPEKIIITKLIEVTQKASREDEITTKLFAVGSILKGGKNGLPPKDIDIAVAINFKGTEFMPNELAKAERSFLVLKGIADQLIEMDPNVKLGEIIEPTIDEEYNNSNILKHQGSIALLINGAKPIELVNMYTDSEKSPIMEGQPYAPLEDSNIYQIKDAQTAQRAA